VLFLVTLLRIFFCTLDLERYLNQEVTVKFTGGREVQGVLKGYDTLVNIVLDNTKELLRTDSGEGQVRTRNLGLSVCKGSAVMLICPLEGTQDIANPFLREGEQT
jgi:U6 snRNA-associated Sm-like protein LSm7